MVIEEGTEDRAPSKAEQITFIGFCRFMRFKLGGREPPSIYAALQKLFDSYDRNGDKQLDITEVTKLLKSLNLTSIQAKTLIAQADIDKDNRLSLDEIYRFLKKGAHDVQGPAYEAWKVLKIWLQMSSGWNFAPKTAAEAEKLRQENPDSKFVTFIRHGQSEANAAVERLGTSKGFFNPALTELGRQQAQERGAAFLGDNREFDLIVVSPMRRTLETFELALGSRLPPEIPVFGHPLVREQFTESDDIGDDPASIIKAWPRVDWTYFPTEPEVWWYPGEDIDPKDQTVASQRELNLKMDWEEPWEQLLYRAGQFEKWLSARPERKICVFSHGGFIEGLVGPRMGNAQECVLRLT